MHVTQYECPDLSGKQGGTTEYCFVPLAGTELFVCYGKENDCERRNQSYCIRSREETF